MNIEIQELILNEYDEKFIIDEFNNKIKEIRDNTYSLIFSSYREFNRKRLDINKCINLLKNIIYELFNK